MTEASALLPDASTDTPREWITSCRLTYEERGIVEIIAARNQITMSEAIRRVLRSATVEAEHTTKLTERVTTLDDRVSAMVGAIAALDKRVFDLIEQHQHEIEAQAEMMRPVTELIGFKDAIARLVSENSALRERNMHLRKVASDALRKDPAAVE